MAAGDRERRAGAAWLRNGAVALAAVAPLDAGAQLVQLARCVGDREGRHRAVEGLALDRCDRLRPDAHASRRDVDDAHRAGGDLVIVIAVVLQAQRAVVGPHGMQRPVGKDHARPIAGPFSLAARRGGAFLRDRLRPGKRGAAIGAGGDCKQDVECGGIGAGVVPAGSQHTGALIDHHGGQELLPGGIVGDADRLGPGGAIVGPAKVDIEIAVDGGGAFQCQVLIGHVEPAAVRPVGVVPGQHRAQPEGNVGQRR